MIYLNYNKIVITSDYKNYNFLRHFLIKIYLEKNVNYFTYINIACQKTKYNLENIDMQVDNLNRALRQRPYDKCDCFYKVFYLYELGENNELIIPIGFLEFIKPYLDSTEMKITYDINNPLVNTKSALEKVNNKLLPGITLRNEQVKAIQTAISLKRTMIQAGTGMGKTECLCGIIKVLEQESGTIPTTLLIEPTDKLKKEMIDRFNKYGIKAVDYNKERTIMENCINISHPASLNIDLKKDEKALELVKVYFSDECHHQQSDSVNTVSVNIPNAEYMIGVSASAVAQDHVYSKNLQHYSVEELKSISMMGLVSYNVTAKDLIENGSLSEPVLLVINNEANEYIPRNKQSDWHAISRNKLQSPKRTELIAKTAVYFSKRNRKSLILINNKEWAYNIAKAIHALEYGDQCRLSFGGNIFLEYKEASDSFEKDKETFDKFRSGEVSILIGTQHLIEGVDVPSLDCVILPAIGKSERIQIQSCGRALRLTKNGNMAYIVDFSDDKDPILSYQFKTRIRTYIDTIGVKHENIHIVDREKIDESLGIIFNRYKEI